MPGDAAEDVATGGLLVFKLMGLMKRGDSSRRREVKKNTGDEGETVILWSFHAHFSHVALSALSRHPSDVYSCVDAEFLTAQPGESELFCVVTATPCARRKKCPVERAADCELQTGKFQPWAGRLELSRRSSGSTGFLCCTQSFLHVLRFPLLILSSAFNQNPGLDLEFVPWRCRSTAHCTLRTG